MVDFMFFIGVGLHLFGSLTITGGQTMVKYAHTLSEQEQADKEREENIADTEGKPFRFGDREESRPVEDQPNLAADKKKPSAKLVSTFGWTIFVIGNISRFVAFRFAQQIVLSALGSAQFILLPIFASVLLGEPVSRVTVLGVIVILFGNGVLLAFSPPESPTFTLDELKDNWIALPMRFYLPMLFGILIVLQLVFQRLSKQLAEGVPSAQNWAILLPICFSSVSAFIGAFSVLLAKCLTYICSDLPNSAKDVYTWVVLVLFILTNVFWLRRMSQGLSLYKVVLIAPLLQVNWIAASIIGGGLYFKEFEAMIEADWVMVLGYLTGLMVILTGAGVLAVGAYHADANAEAEKLQEVEEIANSIETTSPEMNDIVWRARTQSRVGIYSIDRITNELQDQIEKRAASVGGPGNRASVSTGDGPGSRRTSRRQSRTRGSLSVRASSVLCASGGFSPQMSDWIGSDVGSSAQNGPLMQYAQQSNSPAPTFVVNPMSSTPGSSVSGIHPVAASIARGSVGAGSARAGPGGLTSALSNIGENQPKYARAGSDKSVLDDVDE